MHRIPEIKTLVTYIKDNEIKKVLCDHIAMGDDKFASIDYEHSILHRCPFSEHEYFHEEIHHTRYNLYEIVYYSHHEPLFSVSVIVNIVLEFGGKIFLLEEVDYDMREYDY